MPTKPKKKKAADTNRETSGRGFAAMDRELVRKLAQKGGRAAHEQGRAHEFTREEARVAGRKGGLAARRRRATTPRSP